MERYAEETPVIEQEDLLGELCKDEQEVINFKYKLAKQRVMMRELMFSYRMEMMIRDGRN